MKRHLLLVFISIFFGACQVQEEIASVNSSATTGEVSNEFVVTTSANGWKKKNDVIQINLNSLKKIHKIGTSTPYIEALIGSNIRKFYYASGTGTNSITFNYTVANSDLDQDGINFAGMISLNGSIIQLEDDAGNKINAPINLNFKPNEILVDGESPFLKMTTYPEAKSYVTNDSLMLSLVFNENVKLKEDTSFTVSLDSGAKILNYFSGSGSKIITFKGELNSTDSDSDGTIEVNELNFTTQVTDLAGNPFVQLLIDSAVDQAWVNLPKPKITDVTINSAFPPASLTYSLGQNIDIGLKFDQPIVLTGSPSLTININSGSVKAQLLNIAPANQLNFRYTVKSGDLDNDGIILPMFIELNGGTLKSSADPFVPADLLIPTTNTSMVKVSAPQPLKVIFVNSPLGKLYKLGDVLDFTLFYNRPVNVSSTLPQINIIFGNVSRAATYDPLLSNSQGLVFRYTIQNTDLDLNGITVSSTIVNPTSISDAYGATSQTTFDPPYTTAITADAQAPLISSLTVPESRTYKAGDKLQIVANMSENTMVSGTPKIKLTIGTTDVDATYLSGSGTKALIFSYDIASGLTDSDGIAVNSSLEMNGGNLQDSNGNTQSTDIAISPSSTTGVLVDATLPTITIFNPLYLAAKNFKKDENIEFNIAYNKPVQVSGFPCVRFFTSALTFKCARYNPSLSTSSVLRFRYTVAENDSDDDGIEINNHEIFLEPNESIKDSAGNSADLDFSVTILTHLKIDAKAPSVSSVTIPASGNYGINDTLTFKLNWSESITVTGSPKLKLKMGETYFDLNYVSSTATQSTFQLTLLETGLSTSTLELSPEIFLSDGGKIEDTNTNQAVTTFIPPTITERHINTIKPVVTNVSSNSSGRFKAGDDLYFFVNWNKDIIYLNPGNFNLKLKIGTQDRLASFNGLAAGSSRITRHRYTVQTGDLDIEGVEANGISASPVIRDAFDNLAIDSFVSTQFPQMIVDAVAPVLNQHVTAARSYKANDTITFAFIFNEAVNYTGSPFVNIVVGSTTRQAYLTSGQGTNILNFTYTVQAGETDTDGVTIQSPINLGTGGSILDLTGNELSSYIFTGSTFSSCLVDNTPPTILGSVTSDNVTRTSLDNYFIPGDIMEFSVSFNESISVEGNPRLILNIGGVNRYAYYYEATSTSTVKKFRYQVDSGNILLDLNGLSLTTSIDLYGGSITDLAGNPASSYTISYSEKDYVYFTNLEARYHVRSGDYTYSPASGQLSVWKDVTGKGNNLTQTINMNKPTVASTGFGNNSTGYVNFSSSNAFLIIQQDMTIRYAFFALKTPSVTSGLQKFGLITQAVDSSYWDGIDLNWVFQTDYHETLSLVSLANGNKAMLFDPYAKYKMNSDVFNNNYIDKIDTSTLWTPSTNYLMMFEYQSPITLEGSSDINHGDSTIGAFYDEMTLNSFKGQISEIIFASGTLSATQINLIRDQLNDIHGIY